VIRNRGWHMVERHHEVDGAPVSASLFAFGLTVFSNAQEQLARGTGPYFYLPKLESHEEARLWARAFRIAEDELGLPHGSIKCTVLIETILAAYEMDAILYELREHSCALNAGRWDYIFSCIKELGAVLPDRAQVTIRCVHRAVIQGLVQTCHARGRTHRRHGRVHSRVAIRSERGCAREGERRQAPRGGELRRHASHTPDLALRPQRRSSTRCSATGEIGRAQCE
jgi:malate synthase A